MIGVILRNLSFLFAEIPGPEIKTEDSGNQPAEKDQPPVILSDALANFFGIAEKEMLQSEAVQRVMDYIKLNNLEVRAFQCIKFYW